MLAHVAHRIGVGQAFGAMVGWEAYVRRVVASVYFSTEICFSELIPSLPLL